MKEVACKHATVLALVFDGLMLTKDPRLDLPRLLAMMEARLKRETPDPITDI